MSQRLRLVLLVLLCIAGPIVGATGQAPDGLLIGTWNGVAGEELLIVTFNADGTMLAGNQDGSGPGTYTTDFSTTPAVLSMNLEGDATPMLSFIEFVDDDHLRMSQPDVALPPSMAEGNAVVFERSGE